jgi:hypothetical protein
MASQHTINRLKDYLRRRFEIGQLDPGVAGRPHVAWIEATFQAVELDLREIVDLVLREEGHTVNSPTRVGVALGTGAGADVDVPIRVSVTLGPPVRTS